MFKVEILKCNGCRATISLSNTTCEYCGSENIVTSYEKPCNLDQKISKQYINFYKSKLQTNPSDENSLFALGLFYLNLKLYDLAVKTFEKSMDINPEDSEIHYYYALSMIKGRRPKVLTLKEIQVIEKFINSAIQLGDKAKYYYLAALINHDFYLGNGLKVPEPNYDELLKNATNSEIESDENKMILTNVIVREQIFIEILEKKQ